MERQNQAYEQEILLCVRQATEREDAYRQTRVLRHDLKGRLVALGALLEAGQTEETQKELEKMLEENSLNRHGTAETGNLALDALVNYKYAAASAVGIQLSCCLEVPAELFVEGTDLCVILENLLDNALEAVQKLSEEERSVSLAVQLIKGALFITVENPYQGEIIMDRQGKIQSSKTGEHGIGLLSVEKTAVSIILILSLILAGCGNGSEKDTTVSKPIPEDGTAIMKEEDTPITAFVSEDKTASITKNEIPVTRFASADESESFQNSGSVSSFLRRCHSRSLTSDFLRYIMFTLIFSPKSG